MKKVLTLALSLLAALTAAAQEHLQREAVAFSLEKTFTTLPGFSLLAGWEDRSVVPDVSSVTMTEGETSSTASAAPAQGARIPHSSASAHSTGKHFLIIFVRII